MMLYGVFGAYTDFLTSGIKLKPKPIVLHQKTCPICDSKRVNIYYSDQLDKYMCKKCIDKSSREKGGNDDE